MKIEIVTHCYRYSTLLRYQLSSYILHPPPEGVELTATVYYTAQDEDTTKVLESFFHRRAQGVNWNWKEQGPERLCMRSIGRNEAALATQASWVWFADADYWFTTQVWEWFVACAPADEALIFPRSVLGNITHAHGDACIERARVMEGLVAANPADFKSKEMKRAIGGVQIVPGEVCRERGYLKNHRRAQRPVPSCIWGNNAEDVWFRRDLKTNGAPVDIPGVYRIRHSVAGRDVPGLTL